MRWLILLLIACAAACSGPTRQVHVVDPRACDPPAFPPAPLLPSIRALNGEVCMTADDASALADWADEVARWQIRWQAACGPLPHDDVETEPWGEGDLVEDDQ